MRMRRRRNGCCWHPGPTSYPPTYLIAPPLDAQSPREQARKTFLDARDALRTVLEDEIEAETRAACPAATDLDVEVYHDELGETRGRLVAVNTAVGTADKQQDALAERLAELLDEWATVVEVASIEIVFRPLPERRWSLRRRAHRRAERRRLAEIADSVPPCTSVHRPGTAT